MNTTTITTNTLKILTGLTGLTGMSLVLTTAGCGGGAGGGFSLASVSQNFAAQTSVKVNTKIDLLWMVDNSASMDTEQARLRAGFAAFASQYLQPTWDVHIAVITSDAYLANPVYAGYLATSADNVAGYQSPYIYSQRATWTNPPSSPGLVDVGTDWNFARNPTFNDWLPRWGTSWSKLLPGYHDGPTPALCYENNSYFFYGASNCQIRDNPTGNTGSANCINPSAGEDSTTQCVNTAENNTIHSGKPVLATMPPTGTPGDSAWVTQLIDNFTVNVSVGSSGDGSERGMESVLQLLNDNETDPSTAFFRPGSTRGIIFISDEDDQSEIEPPLGTQPAGYHPFSGYATPCGSPTTVDAYTYTLSTCVDQSNLIPVSTFKTQLDNFFLTLDGAGSINPNYFVTAIVATTGASIQSLQLLHNPDDLAALGTSNVAVNQGARYMALANQVGNGSITMDVSSNDYTPILTAIGNTIVQKAGTFTLQVAPTSEEQTIVTVEHADGSTTTIPTADYTVTGTTLQITDLTTVLALVSTDTINIYYEPSSEF